MKICVFGLWHLGSVTAACLPNKGFKVIGLDFDDKAVRALNDGIAPVYEPDLDNLIRNNIQRGTLSFTTDPLVALKDVDVVWVTYDTPVDDDDKADTAYVETKILSIMELVRDGTVIIISSQVPVGFTRRIKNAYAECYPDRKFIFAYSPENLRLGKAIRIFENPDRIVIGIGNLEDIEIIKPIFLTISSRLEWMGIESAEMTKHAINSFLATSVVFANELAVLCESVGANAKEVERGLKTDERIGSKAYLKPGAAFAGGTLSRDINFLIKAEEQYKQINFLWKAVKEGNNYHKDWVKRKCKNFFKDLNGKKIAVLGLTYKPGTNVIRRSWAIELCLWLSEQQAVIQAFDPYIQELPDVPIKNIKLKQSIKDALDGVDCIIVATEHPDFHEIGEELIASLPCKIVIDANGFLEKLFSRNKNMQYAAVGRTLHETIRS